MKTIQEVRQEYPQYSDMSDEQLAKALHGKYYADIPYDEFSAKVGIAVDSADPMQIEPKEPFGKRLNREVADIPRQIGLTVRHGAQGLADIMDIPGAPLTATLNAAFPATPSMSNLVTGQQPAPRFNTPGQSVTNLLDMVGLPKPQTATERIVEMPSRMLAGGGGMLGMAGRGANVAQGTTKAVLSQMAAKPGLQASSAIGSGLAGGYTKETGGDATSQFLASLTGGIVAPVGVQGFSSAKNAAMNLLNRGQQPNVTIIVGNTLKNSGINVADVPKSVLKRIEADVSQAMKQGPLDEMAVKRLVDYRLVGATPARGNLTLNPVDITRQQNLSKIGANSQNPRLNELAIRQNQNTGKLIGGLNQMGADTADDAYAAGQKITGTLAARNEAARDEISAAYNLARDASGRSVPLDHVVFTNKVNDLIDKAMLGGQLPSGVRDTLNKIAKGEIPLTVEVAEQIKTQIGNLQRASNDGSTRMALGFVRQALDDAPLMPSKTVNPGNLPAVPGTVPPGNLEVGQQAIDAFNKARGLHRNWMQQVESTPALQAVVDGIEPDKFVNQFIIGSGTKSNVMDVAKLKSQIAGNPQALQAVRGQILAHLKGKATSGNADELMQFSQSGYNKALAAIGERKLKLFFSPEEINQIKAIGRVASYEQVQPSGSAVNNSNTAGMMLNNVFEWLGNNPVTRKIPFGQTIVNQPAADIAGALNARSTMNVPGALLMPQQKKPPVFPLPLLLTPGLLAE